MTKQYKETRTAQMRKEVIDDMMTDHIHKIGALPYNQGFVVKSVEIEDQIATVEGDIVEETNQ